MTHVINLFVVSSDKHTMTRIVSLSRGSHIAIAGDGSLGDDTLRRITELQPDICLLNARETESAYLECTRSILQSLPNSKVLLFGPSDQPDVMARAAASKVWNYLSEHITYPDFVQAVSDAAAGIPAGDTSVFGQAAAALPSRPVLRKQQWFSASPTRRLQAAVRQCLSLGLTAEDISRHLDTDIDVIRTHIGRIRRQIVTTSSHASRRLFYGAAVVLLCIAAWKTVTATWSLGSQRITVSGNVQYAGKPLDNALIEFRSLDSETAVVSGAVIQDGRYRIPSRKGLLPGTYVVMITSPDTPTANSTDKHLSAVPPAEERIPESYNSASTQRVEVRRLAQNTFDFDVPEIQRQPQQADQTKRE